MIVEPNLDLDPKYIALRQELGEDPIWYLLRLWGNCQRLQLGGNWGKVDASYVEAVCRWPGERGKLWAALTRPLVGGKKAFIELRKGSAIIHDWEDKNRSLVQAWFNGAKGGRPRTYGKPGDNRTVTGGKPTANPIGVDGSGGDWIGVEGNSVVVVPADCVEVPSKAEWLQACRDKGIPEWKAIREFAAKGMSNWQKVRNWRKHVEFLRVIWEQEGRPTEPPQRPGYVNGKKPGASMFEKVSRQRALEKLVAEHPGRPDRAESGDPTKEEEAEFRKKLSELAKLREEIASNPA